MNTANPLPSFAHSGERRPAMPRRARSVRATLAPLVCLAALAGSARAQGFPLVGSGATPGRVEGQGSCVPVVLEGFVFEPDGAPSEGAVVVTSAGGSAITDHVGRYRLEARVPGEATEVQVTAFGRNDGERVASARVAIHGTGGSAWIDPLVLALGTCEPSWLPTFGGQPGANAAVLALAVFDDGSGPALYAGGEFTEVGSARANGIARWDGTSWTSLGSGTNQEVLALAVYDDGSGPALYAGGEFSSAGGVAASFIAKWDGSSWAPLGSGTNNFVRALTVYDDGNGPALYAGGNFLVAGGVAANRIARWDGSSWTALGAGTNLPVYALAAYDDGNGAALYAGGTFTNAGGLSANKIARWNGSSWSTLGSGVSANGRVLSLTVFDDGNGTALYAGGGFGAAGGTPASNIARWDGTGWTALGSGVDNLVNAMTVYDDGSGPALYADGRFTTAGGVAASKIAKWDGSSWSALGSGLGGADILALAAYEDESGPGLYAGGLLLTAGDAVASYIAKWDGSSWRRFGDGLGDDVFAAAEFDDGDGPALYVGGTFRTAGDAQVDRIAKWDGDGWAALDGELTGTVHALTVFDDGSGPALYVGGNLQVFIEKDGLAASIARWDGADWTPLDAGLGGATYPVQVNALEVHDDGSGNALYVAGAFDDASGIPVQNIARWDGSSWAALGSGVTSEVLALTTFDDGGGPALYAGGRTAGGACTISRWDGSSWARVGAMGAGIVSVEALAAFDDGSGPALYAGGTFTTAGGVPVNRIARWDGASWSPVGSGVEGGGGRVSALLVHDDGSGPALYAGGSFAVAGGIAAENLARWDGSSWAALGSGVNGAVRAFATLHDSSEPSLCVGGSFAVAPDSGDSFLARFAGCPDSVPPTLSYPPSVVTLERFGSGPGRVVTFSVTATDNLDPSPTVVCVPPSGSFFPRGTTLVTCTATDALGNESTSQFPVVVQARGRQQALDGH